jgi:hypothetical protein
LLAFSTCLPVPISAGRATPDSSINKNNWNGAFLVLQAFFGLNEFAVQVIHIGTTNITQFDVLEVMSDSFVRIEIGCIAWQLFQEWSFDSSLFEKPLDFARMADRRA